MLRHSKKRIPFPRPDENGCNPKGVMLPVYESPYEDRKPTTPAFLLVILYYFDLRFVTGHNREKKSTFKIRHKSKENLSASSGTEIDEIDEPKVEIAQYYYVRFLSWGFVIHGGTA
jgi:hypothetical protein